MSSVSGVLRKDRVRRKAARSMVVVASLSFLVSSGCADPAIAPPAPVKVNQIGFTPTSQKLAVVPASSSSTFDVRSVGGPTVFTGELSPSALWTFSDEQVRIADFSALNTQGRFIVVVDGVDESPPFEIRPNVHRPVVVSALKAFYYARSATDLDPKFAAQWARPAGHPDDNVQIHRSAASPSRPEGTRVSSPGGWYDAGDYNKYIVNAAFTTATLLAAYEHYPGYFDGIETDIPESGDTVPDIIDEAVFNLRWMLTMQDPADGGVYHKLTTLNFEGMVMPADATSDRFVVQKSTPAALALAATTAVAGRVLARWPQYEALVDDCLAAADGAWDWAAAHPGVAYVQPSDVHTGTYAPGGDDFYDERAWAAVELFLTTGNADYLDDIDLMKVRGGVPSWGWVSPFAWASLARHGVNPPGISADQVDRAIVDTAELLREQAEGSAYRVAMGSSPKQFKAVFPKADFSWGSNGAAACQSMVLLWAYRITGDTSFLDAALSNLDYVLGRNATGYCFVTGAGTLSPLHPHHRPSEADGVDDPVPGFLIGGPHGGRQDPPDCLSRYPSHLPALAYLDHVCSYATNEVAINWNAALVYAAGGLDAVLAGERPRKPAGRAAP